MPIIAGRASAAYGAGFAAITAPPYLGPFGAYDALATITLSSNVSNITFSGIPSGYRHLQIRALTATSTASTGAVMRFNGDAGSNYKGHGVYGSGSATGVTSSNDIYAPNFNGGGATTSPGSAIIDVLDYSSSTKYKTIRSLDGYDGNGSGYVALSSGLWMNTSPISSITFLLTNYVSGCQFAIYGVK
jgi:hypothetical protein